MYVVTCFKIDNCVKLRKMINTKPMGHIWVNFLLLVVGRCTIQRGFSTYLYNPISIKNDITYCNSLDLEKILPIIYSFVKLICTPYWVPIFFFVLASFFIHNYIYKFQEHWFRLTRLKIITNLSHLFQYLEKLSLKTTLHWFQPIYNTR